MTSERAPATFPVFDDADDERRDRIDDGVNEARGDDAGDDGHGRDRVRAVLERVRQDGGRVVPDAGARRELVHDVVVVNGDDGRRRTHDVRRILMRVSTDAPPSAGENWYPAK